MGSEDGQRVGLVLAGGGARGAYEIGALSVLLPELDRRGERPRVIVGTSVGALNSAYLAATADRPVDEALTDGEQLWLQTGYREVLAPLLTPSSIVRGLRFAGQTLGLASAHSRSILDPAPLEDTLRRLIPIKQLAPNVADGTLHAAAFVATSAHTSRTVVFHEGGGRVARDKRGIDYVPAKLGIDHVRASAAIPAVFPAVHIDTPKKARGWYFDGGTRLNTPIKPALKLGAKRVIVIALDAPLDPGPPELASEARPDVVEGIDQFLQAVLVDPMIQDVKTMAAKNVALKKSRKKTGGEKKDGDQDNGENDEEGEQTVPYILIGPKTRGEIGEVAVQVYNEHYRGLRAALHSRDLSLLARAVDGGADPVHGQIMSLLFFAPEFARKLLELGRRDAQCWLKAKHHDGPWEVGHPPTSA